MVKVGNITMTPEELSKSFRTYRKELIQVVMMSMNTLLAHTNVRTGIRYKDTVTEMSGNFEIGNYKKDKHHDADVKFRGRDFETFFGNLVEGIDPNAIYQSIWGSNITKGDALKDVPIVRLIADYCVKKVWENVMLNSFTAAHDSTNNTETSKWFDGFKTILDKDIAGTNSIQEVLISVEKKNLTLGSEVISRENAEDVVKDFYWSNTDDKLRSKNLKLFISDQNYHFYTESYQLNHGALPYNQTYDKKTLEGASNVEFVPLSFVPQNFMLLTPKSNIFCLYNQKGDDESYLVEKSLNNHYDVDLIINAFFGTQFESVSPENLKVWEYNAPAGNGGGE
jgi:hypothetical protein